MGQDWAKKLDVLTSEDALLTGQGLNAHCDAYCHAVQELYSEGKSARNRPLRHLIWHTAFHVFDHAWERKTRISLVLSADGSRPIFVPEFHDLTTANTKYNRS